MLELLTTTELDDTIVALVEELGIVTTELLDVVAELDDGNSTLETEEDIELTLDRLDKLLLVVTDELEEIATEEDDKTDELELTATGSPRSIVRLKLVLTP
jgi:hypothetical protein